MSRGTSPTLRIVVVVLVAAVAVLGVGLFLRASGDDDAAGTTTTTVAPGLRADGTPILGPAGKATPVTPARHVGPQGQVGQFVVKCEYSHSGPNDPIVHRGMEGMSHEHNFYGFVDTDESTTAPDMLGGETTCDKKVDTAAYWHPALYDHGKVVTPRALNAYYRAAPGIDPTTVETMPLGLAMLAGDQFATEPQPGEATGWTCGIRSTISDEVPESCPESAPLHLVLTFPDCWDGEHLDSKGHTSHVAYSQDGACPDTHPVSIPQLVTSIDFGLAGGGHDLKLASGDITTAHGDFLNGWDPDGLSREVEGCIHRQVVCDLGSNRGEEALFQAQ